MIPDSVRAAPLPKREALEMLLLKALDGHGWATTGTLARPGACPIASSEIARRSTGCSSEARSSPVPVDFGDRAAGRAGWIRPDDLELAARLERVRPRKDRGVLLSPFDPVLWDRARVKRLFGFEQMLEIFKPAPSGSTATTACRCSPGNDWWRASI